MGVPARVCVRVALVHGELLLGPRHDVRYGDMPPFAPTLLLIGFSLVLGLYFGVFGLGVMLVRRATGSTRIALVAAPVLWAALELAAARITSVPWDQLGYSQVDNALVNQLAPWTGVYGISFVLVAVNALIAGGAPLGSIRERMISGIAGVVLFAVGAGGILLPPPRPAPSATAVLIQPNLDVGGAGLGGARRMGSAYRRICQARRRAVQELYCGDSADGRPGGEVICPPYPTHPDLVVWPESPAPFEEDQPRFQHALVTIARQMHAPVVIGNIGMDYSAENQAWREYNSALVVGPDGARIGRYDKIHLVPFGEYVPFQKLLFFARKLTGRVSTFDRGEEREVFRLNGHRYGIFICYEAVFADEVRHFRGWARRCW